MRRERRIPGVEPRSAFTLIELLLAISIFSIMALSLYMTFANGVKLYRQSQHLDNVYRESYWVLDALTADLENMVAFDSPQPDRKLPQGAFSGDRKGLSLVVPTDRGLKRVRYYLEEPEYGKVHRQIVVGRSRKPSASRITLRSEEKDKKNFWLIREESPFDGTVSTEPPEDRQPEVLSVHVQEGSLKFSYAQPAAMKSVTIKWKKAWNESSPPLGVRVEMLLAPEKGETAPFRITRDILIPVGAWGSS